MAASTAQIQSGSGGGSGGGGGGAAPITRVSDDTASAGMAAALVAGGHVVKATGSRRANYVYGANVTAGGQVKLYPPGSECPVVLPAGDLYRQPDATLGTSQPSPSGTVTQYMGTSDGAVVAVNILDLGGSQ